MSLDPYFAAKEELLVHVGNTETMLNEFITKKQKGDQIGSSFLSIELKKQFFMIDSQFIQVMQKILEQIRKNHVLYSNISKEELNNRVKFVEGVQKKLSNMQEIMNNTTTIVSKEKTEIINDNTKFINSELQLQKQYEQKAYESLDRLENKLDDVKNLADMINNKARQDIDDLNDMADEIEYTDNHLKVTIRKTKNLIERHPNTCFFIVVVLLFVLLVALIIVVIYI